MEKSDSSTFCPTCKSPINEGASKCPHCGAVIQRWKRWGFNFFRFIFRIIEVGSLIAVVITLFFLYDANRVSKEAFEESRKANLEALARVDSSIILQKRALKIQEGQASTEKSAHLLREKEFFEKNKPVVSIQIEKVTLTDSNLEIFVVVNNEGLSNMENVFVYLGMKKMVNPPTYPEDYWSFPTLLTQKSKVFITSFKGWQNSDFLCFVDVRYQWRQMNYDGSEKKSFLCSYNEETNKYRVKVLDQYDHKKYWGSEY